MSGPPDRRRRPGPRLVVIAPLMDLLEAGDSPLALARVASSRRTAATGPLARRSDAKPARAVWLVDVRRGDAHQLG